jgi:hypothetical protein
MRETVFIWRVTRFVGEVVEGLELAGAIDELGTANGAPQAKITIVKSGTL